MKSSSPPVLARRWLFPAVALLVLAWGLAVGYPVLVRALGGAWRPLPADWTAELSPQARALWEQSLDGLDLSRRLDVHAHVAGIGAGGTGCHVNSRMRSLRHPVEFVRLALYLSASGVGDLERADQEFTARLDRLASGLPPEMRMGLLAFDAHHHPDGRLDEEATEFYVPNAYVAELVARDPKRYELVVSVHPYRADAAAALRRWADRGARFVKWLPNAMGIDPASERCDAAYEVMAERGLILLSHAGEEQAVESQEDQELGNPLRLRRALDHGVRVIAAHCATLGSSLDLDDPARPERSSLELFLRLMDEPRYDGLLFGDISGVTLRTRVGPALERLLEREDLHARLVDGSDYPLPAMNVAISLGQIIDAGFLDPELEPALTELYRAHPLAFDLALKRHLRAPSSGKRFTPEAFVVPASWARGE